MTRNGHEGRVAWLWLGGIAGFALVGLLGVGLASTSSAGQSAGATGEVTFTKDIAPILEHSCESCHHQGGVAPMSLVTYEEVRPYAKSMKYKTSLGLQGKPGAMPPWFVERGVGIQQFKGDMSLSDADVNKIAKWADNGAPMGNASDMPKALVFDDSTRWTLGEPDLILKTPTVTVKAGAPDWWGPIGSIPSGLTEDRYVKSVEYKEISQVADDSSGASRKTVGSRFVFHHLCWGAGEQDHGEAGANSIESFPCHEVGRNGDIFDPEAPRLLKSGVLLHLSSAHLHSDGHETTSHIEMGFRLFPAGYKPAKEVRRMGLFGNSMNLDLEGNTANQHFEAFTVLPENAKIVSFEPHMHAAGVRMCLDAISGATMNDEVLNCVGYDHSWVRVYNYADDAMPLLPKGTILRITGYFDNTSANRNVADPRNWSGLGHRSIDNMMNDLGEVFMLTDEEFQQEMAARRQHLHLGEGQSVLGCPLCGLINPAEVLASLSH
jgi:hypothetical protein